MAELQSQNLLLEEVALLKKTASEGFATDEAVAKALPKGTKVLGICCFGESSWSVTGRVDAVDEHGKPVSYFLKYVPGELGKQQLEGEYVGMSALNKVAPNFVPAAVAWGRLESISPTSYFLLVDFKELTSDLPDANMLAEHVAAMHMNPESVSPTGMFGFHIQTFDGARLQSIAWDPSWTSFFSKLLAEAYRQDTEVNGLWPELDALYQKVQSHLIPRLIGALESEGRSVKPVLIHGDMWDGNVGTDSNTGKPWIFDCAAYYAHNEMELGIWRAERHLLHVKEYRMAYLDLVGTSAPEEEAEDRILLYSAKTNFMNSACIEKSEARHHSFRDFKYLLQKYVPHALQESEEEIDNFLDDVHKETNPNVEKKDIAVGTADMKKQILEDLGKLRVENETERPEQNLGEKSGMNSDETIDKKSEGCVNENGDESLGNLCAKD